MTIPAGAVSSTQIFGFTGSHAAGFVDVVVTNPDGQSGVLPAGYQYVDPAVLINYQGIGSGGGKKGIIDNTLDFAGSDSVLSDQDYANGKDLQMYPILAGAVVPIYNIEGVTQTVTLNRAALVGIFLGEIQKWNDPAITALNPGITFPDAPISVVHRSDGSGTTEIFTSALAAFAPDKWVTKDGKPNAGSAIEWAVDKAGTGIGGKGNQGVAAAVLTTMLATEFGAEPSYVSGVVFITTLLSPFTLTPLLALLGA